jgi:protocatechuate 3,4-dioxygenase beta subunit
VQAAAGTTNDLGQYRIAGLTPGVYMLRASATDTWQDDEGRTTFVYAHTYFPGVTGSEQAHQLTLVAGQEIGNLNFSMRPGRPAIVKGVVRNASGDPMASQSVTLERATRGAGGVLVSTGGPGGATTRTGSDGAFEFTSVPPGEFVVGSGGSTDRIAENIVVSDGEIKSVDLAARRPNPVTGSIVTHDGSPLPFPATQLRVVPVPADPESLFVSFVGPRETTVTREATFRFNDVRGQYLFRMTGLPDEWALTGVFASDVNQVDAPTEFAAEARPLRLVVSKTAARVEGQTVTRDGKPTADCTVVVFAEEPGRWTPASRFIRAARPDDAGRFTVAGLPAGRYRAAAREFVAEGQWEDPEFLTGLVATATRFELAEGGSQSVRLTVEAPR